MRKSTKQEKQHVNGAAPSSVAASQDATAYQALFSALVSIRSAVDLALAALAMLGHGRPATAPTEPATAPSDPRVRAMMEQNRKGMGVSFINPADNAKPAQEPAPPLPSKETN